LSEFQKVGFEFIGFWDCHFSRSLRAGWDGRTSPPRQIDEKLDAAMVVYTKAHGMFNWKKKFWISNHTRLTHMYNGDSGVKQLGL